MTTRFQRVSGSAVAVVVAFWAYRLVAVPLIEPPSEEVTIEHPVVNAPDVADKQLEWLKPYFPRSAWELDNPIVLEGEQAKLIFKEYQTTPDGRVQLTPCTVVFLPGGQKSPSDPRPQRYIIMQVPQGAVLTFDKPLDLSKMQIGQLKGGVFAGPITIHGRSSSDTATSPMPTAAPPGEVDPNEDLLVTTHDMQLSDNRLWTPHEVDMQFGPNRVHGRDLRIDLIPTPTTSKKKGLGIGGIGALEIGREVTMHLLPGEGGFLPGDRTRGNSAAGAAAAGAKPVAPPASTPLSATPMDVRCQGPFRFDLLEFIATFEERVDVLRANPQGPSDQLLCELLSVFFQPKPLANGLPRPQTGALPPLEPRRFEARGRPVVVRAPSTGGNARGERMEYDIQTGKLTLEAPDEAFLQQKVNEFHARSLVYQRDQQGGLLRVVAVGPGWMRGASGEATTPQFEARFDQELRVRPLEQNQVASFRGNASLKFAEQGSIVGDDIHVWFLPADKGAQPAGPAPARDRANGGGIPPMTPERLLATGNVKILSPQLTGSTPRLEVWFKPAVQPQQGAAAGIGGRPAAQNVLSATGPVAMPPISVAATPVAGQTAVGAARGAAPGKSQFDVSGDLIRAQFLLFAQSPELDDLSIDGHVNLIETQTATPGDRPMVIRGDQLQVLKAQAAEMSMSVSGRPGFVDARGLAMEGETIRLNRGQNRLWIDGPGRMVLPVDRDSEGRPLPQPKSMTVNWKNRMDFDGLTARYDRQVTAQSDEQLLRTEVLSVTLAQKLDFAQPQGQQRPQAEVVACQGGAYLENRGMRLGQVVSIDRLQLRDLSMQQSTGAISGQGPGWMTSVRQGGVELPGGPAAGTPAKPVSANDSLTYVHVQFQRQMTGNMHNREITFSDHVKTIQGPVASWTDKLDPDTAKGLGPRDMLLNSDQLRIVQMQSRPDVKPTTELEAIGNTLAEGATYTARAHRVTYAQAKDLLVLEGDGRADAQLFRQEVVGGPQSQAIARKILYWPSTRRSEVDDARYIDLGQLGTPGSTSTPAAGNSATKTPSAKEHRKR